MRFPFLTHARAVLRAAGWLACLIVFASNVRAVRPPEDATRFEVDLRGQVVQEFDRGVDPSVPAGSESARLLERSAPWNEFIQRNPGWFARWDDARLAPERLQGPPAGVSRASLNEGSEAERVAREYASAELSSWVPVDELALVRSVADKNGYWVHFTQEHQGVPVWQSRLTVRISRDGRVQRVTNRTYSSGLPSVPAFRSAPQAAVAAAREGLPGDPVVAAEPALMILPIRKAEGYEYRLTWKSELRTTTPAGHWICFVDAEEGDLLWRFNQVRHAEISGVVRAPVEPVTANGAFEVTPLPHVDVVASQGDPSVFETTTGPDGSYSLAPTAVTGRTVTASLSGPYGVLYNVGNAGATPTISLPAPDGDPATLDFSFDGENSPAEARDAFFHVMVAHDHIQTIEPDFHFLDYPVPVLVNINETCNAYWDGLGVNFYAAGGGCVNTARVADVVYHEYGHGITDWMYRPFAASPAMHEGFSDYYAATITGQPLVGIGFTTTPGSYLRRIDEDRVYPNDWIGESHHDGLIIASALWDMREMLGKGAADSLWHFARYGYSDNYDDYFDDLMLVDDDNGDIYDGFPDFDVLTGAFRAHGIGDYRIHISHAARQDTEDTTRTLPLTASFLSVFALESGSATAHVRITRGESVVEFDSVMTPTGGIREFTTILPRQAPGTRVEYHFTVEDTTGGSLVYPQAGASDPLVFHIGRDVTPPTIVHDALPNQPLQAPSLLVAAEVTDNLEYSVQSVELRYRRNEGESASVPMSRREGNRYEALLPMDGVVLGDRIEYRILAVDGAAGSNRGAFPAETWSSFRVVRGYLRNFEENGGDLAATGEWEWGEPSPPIAPYSGDRIWGTDLDGTYENRTLSTLTLPVVDLTDLASATLAFHHALQCEPEYDGGWVEASTDAGASWDLLVPDTGYDMPIAASGGQPAFSGGDGAWRLAEFNLSAYLGLASVMLRLQFASDEGVTGPGWFIDDLSVVERQVPARPMHLQARSGQDARVPLQWNPPAGVNEDEHNPVLGYNVYRAGQAEGTPSRLNPVPLQVRRYVDTTVQNGTPYFYWVAALYDGQESRLAGPVEAMAYRAVYSAPYTSLAAVADSAGVVVDTTLTVTNEGTGLLELNIYRAGPDDTIDDLRIEYLLTGSDSSAALSRRPDGRMFLNTQRDRTSEADLPTALARFLETNTKKLGAVPAGRDSGETPRDGMERLTQVWDTLATDPTDPNLDGPDLASLVATQDDQFLRLRLRPHDSFAELASSANVILPINTDGNIGTGLAGGELIVICGVIASQNFGPPVILVNESFEPVGGLADFDLLPGFIDLKLEKEALGYPERVTMTVATLSADGTRFLDSMPDSPSVPWLTVQRAHLSVPEGAPQDLVIELDSSRRPDGEYRAKLLLETNDPEREVVEVPILFRIGPPVPVLLSGFTAEATAEGVRLGWQTSQGVSYSGFHVYRRELQPGDGPEIRLTDEPLAQDFDGVYEYVDGTAEPEHEYLYRLAGLGRDGTEEFSDPLWFRMEGTAKPAALWLGVPSPNPATSGASLRYGLPSAQPLRLAVYSLDGRRVRLLREARQAAGFYSEIWNGRDDEGRAVPAGVYFVRLEAGRLEKTRKLTWIR